MEDTLRALRPTIAKRSHGRCEVMKDYPQGIAGPGRCLNQATDIHHMLTKARGGANLDRVGETYHLIHVCRECHQALDGREAYEGDLLLEGSVQWDKIQDKPRYAGPDAYLREHYG